MPLSLMILSLSLFFGVPSTLVLLVVMVPVVIVTVLVTATAALIGRNVVCRGWARHLFIVTVKRSQFTI